MTLEARIEELAVAQRETNDLLRTLLAHAEGDRETLDRIKADQQAQETLREGTKLYGYCAGYFGRDSYADKTILGVEWKHGELVVSACEACEPAYYHTHTVVEAEFEGWRDAALCLSNFLEPEKEDVEPDYLPVVRARGRRIVRAAKVPEKPIEERVEEGWAAL